MSNSLPVSQTPSAAPAKGNSPTATIAAPIDGETTENGSGMPFDGMLDAALATPGDAAAWLQPPPSVAANPFAPLPEAGKDLPATDGLPMAWNALFLVNDPAERGAQATATDPELTLAAIEGEGGDATTQAQVQLLAAKARYGQGGESISMKDSVFARGLETIASQGATPVSTVEANAATPRQDLAAMTATANAVSTGTERSLPSAGVINVPPQHPQWSHALGERMQWMVGQQLQQAEIRLDPPELGSLDVKVTVNKEHATVHFVTHNPQVRDALEAATPRLREMFAESGLNLGDVNVSQESFQQQAAHDGREGANAQDGTVATGDDARLESAGIVDHPLRQGQGLLDAYV